METFHILHLAACWQDIGAKTGAAEAPPLHHAPTAPSIPPVHAPSTQTAIPDVAASAGGGEPLSPPPRIRAAAAQMVFASRTSQDFITPQEVAAIEAWTGRAVLEALVGLEIEPDVRLYLSKGVSAPLNCSLSVCARAAAARRGRKRLGTQGRSRGGPPVEAEGTCCLICLWTHRT